MGRLTSQDYPRLIVAALTPAATAAYLNPAVQEQLIVSKDDSRFLVIRTGWDVDENTYGIIQDVEIKEGTVLIHCDNTEDDLKEELVEAGIPTDSIVKTYSPPEITSHQNLNAH